MKEEEVILSIRHVKKDYRIENDTINVLGDINLDIRRGEFVSIVGASGCGKSTLLKLITSLEDLTSGEILLEGKSIHEPSEKCNMVFQEARLFPWLTVAQNIEFTIPRSVPKEERKRRVQEHIQLVGLSGFENAVPAVDKMINKLANKTIFFFICILLI